MAAAGADHDGVGAEFEGLKHRHGRADAGDAGDVAAGRNHAPCAAADDDRAGGEGGVVAFFDARIKGVTVDVGDGKGEKLGVGKHAGATAGGAAGRGGLERGQTIAAKGGHGGSIDPFGGRGEGGVTRVLRMVRG